MVQFSTSVVVAALLTAPALAAPMVSHEHHAHPGVSHIARREPRSRAALRQQEARDLEDMGDLLARFHGMGHGGMKRLHARDDKKKDEHKKDDKEKDNKKKDDKKKDDKKKDDKKDEHKKDDKKKHEHKKDAKKDEHKKDDKKKHEKKDDKKKEEHKKDEHKKDEHKKEEPKQDAHKETEHSPAVEHQQATEALETPEPTAEAEETPVPEAQEEAPATTDEPAAPQLEGRARIRGSIGAHPHLSGMKDYPTREYADLKARGQRGRGSLQAGGLAQVFRRELYDVEQFSARDWEELEELTARSPFLGKVVRKVKGIFKGKGAAKGAQAGAEVHAATQPAERDLESVEELARRAYFDSEFDELD
ncbi:unnamed protein product [Cyclocybe aegerita]|uniref:Uncharacterized protein n=1 Tax=Cyclocybe aegerita TaxID=1973307 RepID=A0A8S0VQ44_CYCAE|nr:unnamed protein product [Cyclocybe aegerita]